MKRNKYTTEFLISIGLGLLGVILSLIGLAQGQNWFAFISGVLTCVIFIVTYIFFHIRRKDREIIDSSNIVIDGIRIDSLNLANTNRTVNKSLRITKHIHQAVIEGTALTTLFDSEGFCISDEGEEGIELSIQADQNIPFNNLLARCRGYDLKYGDRTQPIYPVLESPDGLSKKIKLHFKKRLKKGDSFHVLFEVGWDNCMAYGKDYFISTLSFKEGDSVAIKVKLLFQTQFPEWVRSYQVLEGKTVNLNGVLHPVSECRNPENCPLTGDEKCLDSKKCGGRIMYIDEVDTSPKAVRVYIFERRAQS